MRTRGWNKFILAPFRSATLQLSLACSELSAAPPASRTPTPKRALKIGFSGDLALLEPFFPLAALLLTLQIGASPGDVRFTVRGGIAGGRDAARSRLNVTLADKCLFYLFLSIYLQHRVPIPACVPHNTTAILRALASSLGAVWSTPRLRATTRHYQ